MLPALNRPEILSAIAWDFTRSIPPPGSEWRRWRIWRTDSGHRCLPHNSETEKEVRECIGRYGKTPTQVMEALGLFDYGGGGYHCIWLAPEDFEIFRRRGLFAVTCPGSNAKLASGIAPVAEFLCRGIPVAVGTDGAAATTVWICSGKCFL